jgi:hypothetical protein
MVEMWSNTSALASLRVLSVLLAFGLSDEKKFSIAALSPRRWPVDEPGA